MRACSATNILRSSTRSTVDMSFFDSGGFRLPNSHPDPVLRVNFEKSYVRSFHSTSSCLIRDRDAKLSFGSVKETEGVDSERMSEDTQVKLEGLFASGIPCPTLDTHAMVIDGTRYDELPIVHIKATRNNTIISLTDFRGDALTLSSCGCEGFKNAKKGTNIAAQATAMTIAQRAKNLDMKFIRVSVKGIGPGRLAAIKGLQVAGLQIVSISDVTVVQFGGPRPKKQRRL